jgi:AcrR family transcriptional regulator
MTEHQSKDVRREQILDAAAKMFISQGYENSTVDEIAREAGLSKGSIYWYFKSKLDILFGLTDRCMVDSQEKLRELAAAGRFGAEALYKCHRQLYDAQLRRPEQEQLFSQLMSLANRYPEIRERLRDYYRQWDSTAGELMEKAVADGRYQQTNTKLLAQAITALYDGLNMRKEVDPAIDVVAVIEAATYLIYQALVISVTADTPV